MKTLVDAESAKREVRPGVYTWSKAASTSHSSE